jgi:hypothetical protein
LPVLGLIAGTRSVLGVGLGLLLSAKVPKARRAAIGWALAAVGALSTIPLAIRVFRGQRELYSS